MKARKIIYGISVFGMLTTFAIGGSGNLYAQNNAGQPQLKKMDTLVADLSLSETQRDKYAEFKSSLEQEQTVEKKEKNMEFVNKLINVMSF